MQREELEALLAAGLSLDAIGRRVGRHPSTVSYWLGKHGLVANGTSRYGVKPAIELAGLRALLDRGLSVTQIAQRLDSTPSRVRRAMMRAGLEADRSAIVASSAPGAPVAIAW